jgi:flagellar motor protein MotB
VQPKRSLPRIDRDEVVEVHEDENAHLWAVSYADFLMALLSFFILFYSVDETSRDNLILNISQQLAASTGGSVGSANSASSGTGSGTGAGTGSGTGAGSETSDGSTPKRMPATLVQALAAMDVRIAQEHEYLVVNFPDNMFSKGKYEIAPKNRALLNKFFEVTKPYNGAFNIYFEGHTDASPLRRHKTRVLSDNYVLSSMRGFSALKEAKNAGFESKYLFVQADSSNTRNSRSLSIRLERRKEKL